MGEGVPQLVGVDVADPRSAGSVVEDDARSVGGQLTATPLE